MMLRCVAVCSVAMLLACGWAACASSNADSSAHLTDAERRALEIELTEMMRLDQLHRTPVSWGTTDPEELARLEALDDEAHMAEYIRRKRDGIELAPEVEKDLMAKQSELDRANLLRLVELTEQHGYPEPERLGLDAPEPTAILIHARPDQFEQYRLTFYEEALAGRMPARKYAMMVDRGLQHRGEVQLYGTSMPFNPATGKPGAPIIGDIATTNAARAELGMPSLETYEIAGDE